MHQNSVSPFDHPKNIRFGRGKILFTGETGEAPNRWVLPGGGYTINKEAAEHAATWIHDYQRRSSEADEYFKEFKAKRRRGEL